jgi:hypothetical protein
LVILAVLFSLTGKDSIIYALFGLLIFSPFMALFYLYTCYRELMNYMQGKPAHVLDTGTPTGGTAGAGGIISRE